MQNVSRNKKEFIGGDKSLWMVILVLCIASVLVIYSSTASMAYKKMDGNTSYYLVRQIKFVLSGLAVIFIFHHINYNIYFKHAKKIFIVSVILMLLTFFTGETYNDAARWLKVPYTSFTFQPSDVLKIALVIILARGLATKQKIIDKIPILPSFSYFTWQKYPERNFNILHNTTMPLIGPIILACMLVVISNLSTAVIMGGACVIVLIIGRVRWKEIWRLIMLAMVIFTLLIAILKLFNVGRVDTWIARVERFVSSTPTSKEDNSKEDKEADFQAHQAKIAVASGWIMGKGPGRSTQRSNLPHPYSDYAYAFVIEEYGLFGALFILGCYLWIFYRAMVIFRKCETAFPSILVLGLSLMITLQALLHMAVSVDATPVTGQTLPIISLGGSALLFVCVSLGIILGVSRQQNKAELLRRIEEKRSIVIDEWQQVVADEKEMEKEGSNYGVIWDERNKGNR